MLEVCFRALTLCIPAVSDTAQVPVSNTDTEGDVKDSVAAPTSEGNNFEYEAQDLSQDILSCGKGRPNSLAHPLVTQNPSDKSNLSQYILSAADKSFIVSVGPFRLPQQMLSYTDDKLCGFATTLANVYSDDLSEELASQIVSFTSTFKTQNNELHSAYDVASIIIVENYVLVSTFPDICTAYLLFLSLSVTVVRSERSFSKLKLIKKYFRSSMGQLPLSGLALISVERACSVKLDLESNYKIFAERKARKKNLF